MSGWCSKSKVLNSFESDEFACAWKCHANENCNSAYHYDSSLNYGWCIHSDTEQGNCTGDMREIGKYNQIYSKKNEIVSEPDMKSLMRGNDKHLKP